ncbi:NPCBM/NEW2 domain-containing protein [Streptomyces sp. NPDC051909]|uniref:NPCBM/NEW2 domain-containing protein n=1 Tax=Streptomyces sp. NPDC051909 TaxID=3154944 RepID=UPI003423D1CC
MSDDALPPNNVPPAPSSPPTPPLPTTPPPAAAPPPPRRLGEIAALISALAAVAGVLLGFFGLPAVINSPTARKPEPQAPVVTTTPPPTVADTTSPPASSDTTGPETSSTTPLPALPTGTVLLKDLEPFSGSIDYELRPVTMGTKRYDQAMVFTNPCDGSPIQYSVNERYKSLTFTAGLDDNTTVDTIKVTVMGDGRARKAVGLVINRPQTVTVDVTGVVKLSIVAEGPSCSYMDGIVAALGNPTLHS